jgi:hypothetical protein
MTRRHLDMPTSTIAQTIHAVRADGRQRSTRCPAHDDNRASLSVATGDEGRILLHCFAGCTYDAIVAAAGLEAERRRAVRAEESASRAWRIAGWGGRTTTRTIPLSTRST